MSIFEELEIQADQSDPAQKLFYDIQSNTQNMHNVFAYKTNAKNCSGTDLKAQNHTVSSLK